ncbi:MAG: choice-of-anchor D domain-containing protein [Candidatus Latescibacteria bacterium]|nr:choice-of-anchor D domain-containing protein [Candidatus Latescibacterota bacterium]
MIVLFGSLGGQVWALVPKPIEQLTENASFTGDNGDVQIRVPPGTGETLYERDILFHSTLRYYNTRVDLYVDVVQAVIRDRRDETGLLEDLKDIVGQVGEQVGEQVKDRTQAFKSVLQGAIDKMSDPVVLSTVQVSLLEGQWGNLAVQAGEIGLDNMQQAMMLLQKQGNAKQLGDAAVGGVLVAALANDLALERLDILEAAMRQRSAEGDYVDPALLEAIERVRRPLRDPSVWKKVWADLKIAVATSGERLVDWIAENLPEEIRWTIRPTLFALEVGSEQTQYLQNAATSATLSAWLNSVAMNGRSEYVRRYLHYRTGYIYFDQVLAAVNLPHKGGLSGALESFREWVTGGAGGESALRAEYNQYQAQYSSALDDLAYWERNGTLSVEGPTEVNEDSTTTIRFKAFRHYGSEIRDDVTMACTWALEPQTGSTTAAIVGPGELVPGNVVGNQEVVVRATGYGLSVTYRVKILDKGAPSIGTIAAFYIVYPGNVYGGEPKQMQARVEYVGDSGHPIDVAGQTKWSVVGRATITGTGQLVPADVTRDTTVVVWAIWAGHQTTDTITVQVNRPILFFRDLDMGRVTVSDRAFIRNYGTGALHWRATSKSSWITIDPPEGTIEPDGANQPTVRIDRYGWTPNTEYTGEILVEPLGNGVYHKDLNGRKTIRVTAKALDPAMVVHPTTVDLDTANTEAELTIEMAPTSGGILSWVVQIDDPWLTAYPSEGVGPLNRLRISANPDSLGVGSRVTSIIVNGGRAGSIPVQVSIVVPEQSPIVSAPLGDLTLSIGDGAFTRDLEKAPRMFNDTPGDNLTYTAKSDRPDVVEAQIVAGSIKLMPFSQGVANVRIVARDAAGHEATSTSKITVSTPPGEPLLSLGTTAIDFGTVTPGKQSSKLLPIKSVGNDTLRVSSLSGLKPPFSQSAPGAFGLAPGDSAVVQLVFSPTTQGSFVDTLLVVSNGGNAEVVLTGTSGGPALSVTPSYLAFDSTTVKVAVSKNLNLTNNNNSALPISLSMEGPDKSQFAVSGSTTSTLAASGTATVTVVFTPTSIGPKSATLVITPTGGVAQRVALNGKGVPTPPTQVTLAVGNVSGSAGDTTVVVPITVTQARGIAGGDLLLSYEPTVLTVKKAEAGPLATAGAITVVPNLATAGKVQISMAGASGLAAGNGVLLQVTFAIKASAPLGNTALGIVASLSDENGASISVTAVGGQVSVVPADLHEGLKKGDVNGDGKSNSADAVLVLRYSAGLITLRAAQQWAGDVNGDGKTNAADAILILRKSVGLLAQFPAAGKVATGVVDGLVRVESAEQGDDGWVVPLVLAEGVAGVDLQLSCEAEGMQISKVEGSEDVLVVSRDVRGRLQLAVARGAGAGELVLRVHLQGANVAPGLVLAGQAYNEGGEVLGPVVAGMMRPAGIIVDSYPNPFNASTMLRYDLAQAGAVELRIYDVSGALVRHLVSQWQGAGHYEMVWDGRNDKGVGVGSGIYLACLDTRELRQIQKLMLLK